MSTRIESAWPSLDPIRFQAYLGQDRSEAACTVQYAHNRCGLIVRSIVDGVDVVEDYTQINGKHLTLRNAVAIRDLSPLLLGDLSAKAYRCVSPRRSRKGIAAMHAGNGGYDGKTQSMMVSIKFPRAIATVKTVEQAW